LAYSEIAVRLGVTKGTVAYHARRLGIPADEKCARRYDWDAIQRAYDAGLTVRQCAARFGFNLASWHQAKERGDVVPRPRSMPIEHLLVTDRPQTNRSHLKHRLLDAGLKENRCERCGLTEWQGEPLSMQLHHRTVTVRTTVWRTFSFSAVTAIARRKATVAATGTGGTGRITRPAPADEVAAHRRSRDIA